MLNDYWLDVCFINKFIVKGVCSSSHKLEKIDFDYGVGRMTNLIAAWHDQLVEVMGAMGMREVRRIRGDIGRAMFFENLEEETFGKLFGSRKSD